MKTIYFKFIAQRTTEDKTILVAVISDDMLGSDLPDIVEVQAFLMPATIYTGAHPRFPEDVRNAFKATIANMERELKTLETKLKKLIN